MITPQSELPCLLYMTCFASVQWLCYCSVTPLSVIFALLLDDAKFLQEVWLQNHAPRVPRPQVRKFCTAPVCVECINVHLAWLNGM